LTEYTAADLGRLALSGALRDLSETLRLSVATPDEGDLAAGLWSELSTGVPAVQDALIGYLRTRGRSWPEIAAVTGLSESELCAREPAPAGAEDPAVLDAWYVRRAQLEPSARVPDPVSRLLDGRAPAGRQCLICAKYAGHPVPPWAGFAVPPGGHLVDDGRWRVGHGPTPYWPAGTLLIESHRHFLDQADLDPDEAATLGPLISRLTGPLKEATGASRIHVFSCMEGTEHFHLWLVPRTDGKPPNRTFLADPGHCGPGEAEEVVQRLRKSLESGL
jgi:diadenosine tetraphosphate (Ap4A) HIT family hydrolase